MLYENKTEYYPRFGFVESKHYGITDRDGYNYPAFMAMELEKGYLKNASGKFYESPIYDDSLNRDSVIQYDKYFR